MQIPEAFFVADGGDFVATEYTSGPWDPRAQHGGPPAGLLVGQIERAARLANPQLQTIRVTIDLVRPVPVGRVTLGSLEPLRQGRRVAEWRGSLSADGKVCLRAQVLLLSELALPTGRAAAAPSLPPFANLPTTEFSFFRQPIGYHKAVDLRWAVGTWGSPPCGAWGRQRVPLILGQDPLPIERTLVVADAANGVGAALPLGRFSFVNADLTVALFRPLAGEWVGLLVDTAISSAGIGQTHATIEDERGPIGYGLQHLVIAAAS